MSYLNIARQAGKATTAAYELNEIDELSRSPLPTTAQNTTTAAVDNSAELAGLLARYAFRPHAVDRPLDRDELGVYLAADLDALCDCGKPASHLTARGLWQCPRCAGQGEVPEPAGAYDELRRRLHEARSCAGRARRAGDLGAAEALAACGDHLAAAYAAEREKQ